jgi:hypothetical protein
MIMPPIDKHTSRVLSQIITGAGFLALFLLTASLVNLEFKPGQVVATQNTTRILTPISAVVDTTWLATICLFGLIAMFPIALILLIISSKARRMFKDNLKVLIVWFIFLLVARFYILYFSNEEVVLEQTESPASLPDILDPPSSIGSEKGTGDVYTPPELPDWQGYILGFVVVISIGTAVYYFWEKNRSTEDGLREIALRTLREMNAGRKWEDAVIQCYAEMNAAVSHQRQLNRDEFMTPGEFARRLEEAGLPTEPVRKLTQLFERARYSSRSSQNSEATDAVQCLTAITLALEATE